MISSHPDAQAHVGLGARRTAAEDGGYPVRLAPSRSVVSLDRLIRPRSIAIVGASERSGTLANLSLTNLLKYQFTGHIFPVNPRHGHLEGVRCYPTIEDLPEAPDTAIVLVPAPLVVDIVRRGIGLGIRSYTILSSGFDDGRGTRSGQARSAQLTELVHLHGIRILGPNCIGVMNVRDRIIQRAAAFLPEVLAAGPVSIVSQSGGASLIAFNRAQAAGVGIDFVLPSGNELDVTLTELLDYLIEDGTSRAICLFVETIQEGRHFIDVARRAREHGISLFALKVGRSAAATEAVVAHTGAIVGEDDVYQAALDAAGIVRVRDLDALHEAALIVSRHGPLRRANVAVVCVSGGEAALLADDCSQAGLNLPRPSPSTRKAISQRLRYGTVNNPLDLTGQLFSGDTGLAHEALLELVHDRRFDVVFVAIPTLGENVAAWLGPVLAQVAAATPKPVVVGWWSAGAANSGAFDVLKACGVTVLAAPYRAIGAIAAAAAAGRPIPHLIGWRGRLGKPQDRQIHPYTGAVARRLFARTIRFAASLEVESNASARLAARRIGYPVVAKLAIQGMAHKSELGAVVVGITSENGLNRAIAHLTSVAIDRDPVPMEIQRHIAGVEFIVGSRWDRTFGPTVTVGAGGVLAELHNDAITCLAPVSMRDAVLMLRKLRIAPLFKGYRGAAGVNLRSLAKLVSDFSKVVARLGPGVVASELNPVIVPADGSDAVAVDVLVEASYELD